MIKTIKKKAKNYISEHHLKKITFESLEEAADKDGYTVIKFNNSYNDEDINTIIKNLRLEDIVACSRGFTYSDENYRLIFINEDLNDKEKILVLSHELGHIVCNHTISPTIIGVDVIQEHEANEFSHYLLKKNLLQKFKIILSEHRRLTITISVLALLFIMSLVGFCIKKNESLYMPDLYITSTGNKYHKKECIFVKDKTSKQKLSKEKFESGRYEACNMCLP